MLRTVGLLALALASGSAHALGLGQIQVKSGLGQPLLAEIPVISNDPSELVGLDAALASPETFTRIGLEPPVGIVADLHFVVGSDMQGRPVIRITTTQPVTQPLLNFLIEVDWGQGRLVREYTAAVAGPGSIAAQPPEPVEAPAVEAAPVIEQPAAVASQAPVPTPATATQARPVASVPEAAPQPASAQAPAAPDAYRVRAGDTASVIASRVAPEGVSAAQTMVGLLRANPRAFIDGDLNRIRSGSVLRVPPTTELQAIEAREAADLVRTYARQWRQARSAPQTPLAAADAATRAPAAAPSGRLEIVPPGAGQNARGGTQSGIEAGGEGDMVRQELQQTKETLAARDAEVQELKGRVAELERLQADQQKLIAMQNSQLHASQQQKAAEPPPVEASSTALPWIAGGTLVLLGVLAAAWNRRRSRREPVFRAPAEPARPSLAEAFAAPAATSATPSVATDPGTADTVPPWERGVSRPARGFAEPVATGPIPAEANAGPDGFDAGDAASAERLELAQAYLDLGDTDSARRLLGEVADSGDAATRSVAARMLRDIG